MGYTRYWRMALILIIVGLLAFGGAIVGLASSPEGPYDDWSVQDPDPQTLIDDERFDIDCDLQQSKYDYGHPGELEEQDEDCGWFIDGDFKVWLCFEEEKEDGEYLAVSFEDANMPVYFVYVKYGGGADLWYYEDGVYEGGPLEVPGPQAISHVSFYWCEPEDAVLDAVVTLDHEWTAEWDWDIEKSVTPDERHLFKGDTGTSQWTVEVTKDMINEESILFGEFCVENDGNITAQGVNVTLDFYEADTESVGQQQTYSLGDIAVGADPVCEDFLFELDLTEGSTYTVEMTVTLDNGDDEYDEASVTTTRTVTGDDEVEFTDERNPDLDQTLSATAIFNYDEIFDCENVCEECFTEDGCNYENTARIEGADWYKEDSADVTVWCYKLDVTKDADTSFTRTHDWEIDKSVTTDNEEAVNGTPKIWLYPDESGNESAYWEVCVTYKGFVDSDQEVNGTISIHNPAPVDAVINSVSDVITASGLDDIDADINIDGITFPYTLEAEDTLELDYSADLPDDFTDGTNTATAVQQNFDYHYEDPSEESGTTSYSGSANVIVSDEPTTEVNKEVDVVDKMLDWAHPLSTNGDVVTLGTLDADDFEEGDDPVCFDYDEFFAWTDYPPDPEDPDWEPSWEINNTAKVIGDDEVVLDEDDAKLKINWLDEELTVTKTVETSYVREHEWDIDKSVETEEGYTVGEDTPKVWLYIDGSGDETATWNVCVTYLGFEDSDHVVFGEINIENENTGDYDWDAEIINIVDELAGDSITIYLDDSYTQEYIADPANPIVLAQGEDITLYYQASVDSKIEGNNEVTVTTTVRDYSAELVEIGWGEPVEELYKVVNIADVSDYFGTEHLGTLNADDANEEGFGEFSYDYFFAYDEYDGPAVINNTATIVETEESASAILKINTQEFIYDSAWAKGEGSERDEAVDADEVFSFCEYDFSNWGWTNLIGPGEYEWDLWAGAAQCDTDNGTLVGSVDVDYDEDGNVTVTYNLLDCYELKETHVYAGEDKFPQQQLGRSGRTRSTVAPGQYYNDGPFDGSEVYVIAHAVVGIPDPDFGPAE